MPFIMYGIIRQGGSVHTSYIVIVVLQVFIMAYPLFLETVRDARSMVEPVVVPPSALGSEEEEMPVDEVIATRVRQRTRTEEKSPVTPGRFGSGVLGKVASKLGYQPESNHREDTLNPGHGSEETVGEGQVI